MTPGSEGKGRGGGGTDPKRSLSGNKRPTQVQSLRHIVRECKLFLLFQKAAFSDLRKRWTIALRISIASASSIFKSSNLKRDIIFFSCNLVRPDKIYVLSELHINLAISNDRETEESHCKALIHGSKFTWFKQTRPTNWKNENEEKILCAWLFICQIWKYSTLIFNI